MGQVEAGTHGSRALPEGVIPAGALAFAVAGAVGALGGAALLAGGVMAGVLIFVLRQAGRHYPHARFGGCNAVTLARAGAVVGLAALLPFVSGGWMVLAVAAVALAADGVDGWLARRSGLSSAFGARFDMEVDAALAAVLAGHLWLAGQTGVEILALGLMRYVFVAGFLPFPWLAAPLPERFGRKAACVVQIAALILLQAPGWPEGVARGIGVLAVAVLCWSFGRDVIWLWRNRG